MGFTAQEIGVRRCLVVSSSVLSKLSLPDCIHGGNHPGSIWSRYGNLAEVGDGCAAAVPATLEQEPAIPVPNCCEGVRDCNA